MLLDVIWSISLGHTWVYCSYQFSIYLLLLLGYNFHFYVMLSEFLCPLRFHVLRQNPYMSQCQEVGSDWVMEAPTSSTRLMCSWKEAWESSVTPFLYVKNWKCYHLWGADFIRHWLCWVSWCWKSSFYNYEQFIFFFCF